MSSLRSKWISEGVSLARIHGPTKFGGIAHFWRDYKLARNKMDPLRDFEATQMIQDVQTAMNLGLVIHLRLTYLFNPNFYYFLNTLFSGSQDLITRLPSSASQLIIENLNSAAAAR
jgi:hypothetical protein